VFFLLINVKLNVPYNTQSLRL